MESAAEGAPPETVVVVLNWCGEDDTAACLRSLLPQSRHSDAGSANSGSAATAGAVELLLVDNGSPDGSGEQLHAAFPEVPYLQTGQNLGYTGGNNAGIAWALERGAERVLILNDDTVVEPGAVERLVETARNEPDAGAVVPQVVYDSAPDTVWYGGGAFSAVRGLGVHLGEGGAAANGVRPPEDVSFLTGCAVLLSAEALRDVGPFADDFFAYTEDAELSVRLRRAGWRIVYEPRATVRHRIQPLASDPDPHQIHLRDRNRRRLMRRHFGALRRIPFYAWFYSTRMVHLGRYLVRGDLERAKAIVRGMVER